MFLQSIDAYSLLLILMICIGLSALLLNKVQFLPTQVIQRSSPIDGLRGLLALSVFTHHFYITYVWKTAGIWTKPKYVLIDNFGSIGVSLFFLITGYLFTNKIMKEKIDWKQTYLSRVKRIYPLYLSVFIIILVVTVNHVLVNQNNLFSFVKWVISWLTFRGGSFNTFESSHVIAGVAWTLLYEWKFYACLPIIYCIYHKKIPIAVSLLIAATLLYYILNDKSHYFYALFILSIPAIKYQTQFKQCNLKYRKTTHAIVIGLSVFSLFFTEPYTVMQMVSLAIVFAFIANGYSFFGVFYRNGLKILGEISYSIYLIHGLVLYFFFSILHVFDFNTSSLSTYYLTFPFIFVVVILVSMTTYKLIESPFLRKSSAKVHNSLAVNK